MMRRPIVGFGLLCLLIGAACNFAIPGTVLISQPTAAAQNQPEPTVTSIIVATLPPTATPATTVVVAVAGIMSAAAPTDSPTLVPSPTVMAGITPTPFPEPAGCERPPDNYARVRVNGETLNARTVWMLKHARALYNGTIDFAGTAVTQGSFNPGGVAASFGTHDGGGAVDLSVLNRRTGAVLRSEIPAAIRALRIAGFAAWLREVNELYAGSPIHIHAIAIGDKELSPAARDQLTGPFGYFRGYNGLPKTDNIPVPDRHGGPIFCRWMLDMGYRDLRRP